LIVAMRVRSAALAAFLGVFVMMPPAYAQRKEALRPPRDQINAPVSKPPRAPASHPCAQFGPGFARVDGTDTCIKIGGSIGIGGGISSHSSSP
jgi:hypothetical protein